MSTVVYLTVPPDLEIDLRSVRCHCGTILNDIIRVLGIIPKESKKISFADYAVESVFSDTQLIKNEEDQLEASFWLKSMKDAFRKAVTGDVIPLGKGDHDKIMKALKKPSSGYNATFVDQVTTFLAAFKNVSEKDPRIVEPAEQPSAN